MNDIYFGNVLSNRLASFSLFFRYVNTTWRYASSFMFIQRLQNVTEI